MKNKITFLLLLICSIGYSQSFIGFTSDNYSGVHSVIANPANIVDSRLKTDINLFGFSVLLDNDYYAVNKADLLAAIKNDVEYDFNSSGTKTPKTDNNILVNTDVLGPSFMFNIAPKHSIAISTRARGFLNITDINSKNYELLNELQENGINNASTSKFTEGELNINANVWAELGLSYATVLMDKNKHFLKGGLTLKYLQGTGTLGAHGRDVTVDYERTTEDLNTNGTLDYGYTQNIEDEFENFDINDYKKFNKDNGFGVDLGFVYEWRPNFEEHKYKNSKGISNYYKDVNKYKFKVGLSITDIGSINYEDAKGETYNITRNFTTNPLTAAERTTIEGYELSDIGNIKKVFNILYPNPTLKNSIKVNLPTAIHLNADWYIKNKFYLNLDTNFDISSNKYNTSRISNSYILTPRFETKYFSAYVPMGIYGYSKNFNAGFGLRSGPLYIGSGSIITNVLKDEIKAADIYFGLKIPIFQSRPKDSDGDSVFDKIDNCPKVAGPSENDGCPWGDKDEDGVLDNVDKCVDVAGPSENNGCPWGDEDKDGVLDNVDKCVDVAGPIENNGCPFTDTDGDGIADKDDQCPKVVGLKQYKGCPADSDGDGVIDTKDKCPKVAGTKENNGCPEVKVITIEAKKKLAQFAKAIYFNSGKTSFKTGVTGMLNMIVDVLTEYNKAKFSIEGHTDSQGAKASNLSLSERRAKAVLDYLVRKGISSDRLTSYGFGEEYPIDSNKTRTGRSNNRRVEIKLKN